MTEFHVPDGAVGPGTQPPETDGAELDILELPSGMNTYMPPPLPEPEEVEGRTAALELLGRLHEQLASHHVNQAVVRLDLSQLDGKNLELVDQVLGEGEVSIVCQGDDKQLRIQEAVMAGIWRVKTEDAQGKVTADCIEIGVAPAWVQEQTFQGQTVNLDLAEDDAGPGVLNAPPLIAEIAEQIENWSKNSEAHVINLTLLPQTEEDLAFLAQKLGEGRVTILSRGYGNCRITSTATPNVWWVQYFNSQDKNILNTIEITDVPEVACAAQEDLQDSAMRLAEILEMYQ